MITNNKIPRTQLESDKGVNVIYRDFTISSALTGTTAITLINTALIPANTITVNDEVEIRVRSQRNTATGTATNYIYYNTSASLSGATLIATVATAAIYWQTKRSLHVRASNDTEVGSASTTFQSDDNAIAAAASSLNINWSNNVYIIHAFANAANGDSTTSRGIIIKRARL